MVRTHYLFMGNIGFVRCLKDDESVVYYIKAVNGFDMSADILDVMNWGNKFPVEAGNELFNNGFMAPCTPST